MTDQDLRFDSMTDNARLEFARDRLKAGGLRFTQPRMQIIATLMELPEPTPIDEIHRRVSGACDLVTVYRCLTAFERIGLVTRAYRYNGTTLWQISLSKTRIYHVFDTESGGIQKLDLSETAGIQQSAKQIEAALRESGYRDVTHVVQFFATASSKAART